MGGAEGLLGLGERFLQLLDADRDGAHFHHERLGRVAGALEAGDLVGNHVATMPQLFDFLEYLAMSGVNGFERFQVGALPRVARATSTAAKSVTT